jgi:uncharacterized protein (TIGR02246 family)
MRYVAIVAGLSLALASLSRAAAQPKTESEGSAPVVAAGAATPQPRPEDEQAIRGVVAEYARAFNAADAKGLAALFAADAEIVNEERVATQGREAIERVFAGVFEEHPKARLEITVQSIHFVSPTVAVEKGTTTLIPEPEEPAQRSPYTVVHAKLDGAWRMVSAEDLPDEPMTADEQLKPLQWLIGQWVDESPDALIKSEYRWTENHCYILDDFTVQINGRPAMTGTQRIGWDPLAKQIRSWVFDSEGGFGEGVWTRDGNRWIVKMTGVRRDGKTASSTNITTRVSKDRMTWQSRDRMVGGEKTPDIEEIPSVRQPPQPKPIGNAQ